jgi:hypothetical protein
MAQLMIEAVFPCDLESDPDSAVSALHRAGFEVHTTKSQYPNADNDFFIEIVRDIGDAALSPSLCDHPTITATMQQVENIIAPYGGDVVECGPVDMSYEPFARFFVREP